MSILHPEILTTSDDRSKLIRRAIVVVAVILFWLFMFSTAKADTSLVSKARSYIGMNAKQIGLHRRTLWCSAFMRHIAGTPAGVNDRAISWNGQRHVAKQIGAIVIVRSRRTHVGVVSGFDAKGNPKIISGNHNNRVAEAVYPASRVIAYVAAPGANARVTAQTLATTETSREPFRLAMVRQ